MTAGGPEPVRRRKAVNKVPDGTRNGQPMAVFHDRRELNHAS
jgi:hypothetical protein